MSECEAVNKIILTKSVLMNILKSLFLLTAILLFLGSAVTAKEPNYFKPKYIMETMVKVTEWQSQHSMHHIFSPDNGVFL